MIRERATQSSSSSERSCSTATLTREADQVVDTVYRMLMLLRNVESALTQTDLCVNLYSSLLNLKNELMEHQIAYEVHGVEHPWCITGDGAQLQMAVLKHRSAKPALAKGKVIANGAKQ